MKKLMFFLITLIVILTISLIKFIANNPNYKRAKPTEISLDSISIIPKWEDKTIIHLELKRTKTIKNGRMSHSTTSISDIKLIITKNNNNTWNGKWIVKNIKTPSFNSLIEKKIESLTKGFTYNFTLDSVGRITELINWKEIQTKGFKALDIAFKDLKNKSNRSPEAIKQLKMNMSQLFNTKEKIETSLMQEVQLYFALGGTNLNKLDTIKESTYITNPFTDNLIRNNLKTIYQKAYSNSTCDVKTIQTTAKEELDNMLKNSINKILEEQNTRGQLQSDIRNKILALKIVSNYNISLLTGLVEKVTARKIITTEDELIIDRIVIKQK